MKDSDNGRKLLITAVLAAGAGYLAGILTAPKSGKQTREDIAGKAADIKHAAEERVEMLHEDIDELIAKGKAGASNLSDKARQEFRAATVKAQAAKRKSKEVIQALRVGDAGDPDLQKAVKRLKEAKESLAKYIKN